MATAYVENDFYNAYGQIQFIQFRRLADTTGQNSSALISQDVWCFAIMDIHRQDAAKRHPKVESVRVARYAIWDYYRSAAWHTTG